MVYSIVYNVHVCMYSKAQLQGNIGVLKLMSWFKIFMCVYGSFMHYTYAHMHIIGLVLTASM